MALNTPLDADLMALVPLSQASVVAATASSTPPDTSPSLLEIPRSTAVFVPPKPKKKRSHSTPTRDRERRELLALRVEAVELQKQLQQTQERIAIARKRNRQEIASSGGRVGSLAPAWRHIARRYSSARRSAERENRRLREQLADHLKWGNALQAKVDHRATATERRTEHRATVAALGTVTQPLLLAEDEEGITDLELELDDADRAELEMLASGLDAAYAETDSVFKEHDVGDVPLGATSGSRTVLGSDVVELRDARVIPFDFRLTIDAVWNAWVLWHLGGSCRKSVSAHRSCSYPDVAQPEHTFAVKFRLQCAVPKAGLESASPMFLDLKLVLRRYMEPDRIVLVWRGLSAGEDALAGLFTDETGWVAIEHMTPFQQTVNSEGRLTTAAARTSMRSCVRMTPKRADYCLTTPTAQSDVLMNLVVNSYEEDVSFIYREIEAQLLRVTRHV
ncbi:hypothetical protein PHYBOEH_006908 [Phytophthora boehmeriae]|uniref:M96 mating-specific protein family n=1 Tax=Phytophthora boehmeriae TaxID=109152 RepID=A0A8T1WF90_9STRA|nr:hypothetical protein PHYBOEH_006908 [Phytophthora boehmeriae]